MASTPAGCDTCNASVLSLLLLRASPIAKVGPLVPLGAQSVESDDALLTGLLPKRAPTESRYVLRLLRAGYVHVYIPAPPKGMKNWLVYRVTEQADLVPEDSEWFAQNGNVNCKRTGSHNFVGMKLLKLPQAHKIDGIWIAYSANLWNKKLREQNKANGKVMQFVPIGSKEIANTFAPTPEHLKQKVLECALHTLSLNRSTHHDFPFNSLADQVASLAEQLTNAAACHPRTRGKELAVVLRDPVGIATELNSLRLRRQELSEQYTLQPENRQPMEVAKLIQILESSTISDVNDRAMEWVSPLRTQAAFSSSTWPAGTQWSPLTHQERAVLIARAPKGILGAPYRRAFQNKDLGRVIYPDAAERAATWAEQESEKLWSPMRNFYDGSKIEEWRKDFQDRMQRLHLDPLKKFEADWGGALEDGGLLSYFASHFDDAASNTLEEAAKYGCCSGTAYVREAYLAFMPEPFTSAAMGALEKQLDANILNAGAVVQRAMVANQSSLLAILADEKRDKTYDFIKGLIGEFATKSPSQGQKPSQLPASRYSWLTDSTLAMSFGLMAALSAVAVHGVASAWQAHAAMNTPSPTVDPKILNRLSRAQAMAMIHRASEEALMASMDGRKPNMPVYVVANFDPETATQIMKGRGELQNAKTLRQWYKQGRVQMGILVDAATFASLKSQPQHVIRDLAMNAQSVKLQEQAMSIKQGLVSSAVSGGVVLTTPSKLLELYEAHRKVASQAAPKLTQWMVQLKDALSGSPTAQGLRQAALSRDGRLAIGSMIVQGIGVSEGLKSLSKASKEDEKFDAMLSISDGVAGVLGGFAELAGATLEARLLLATGSAGVQASAGVPFLRGAGFGAGFAGNVINAWMSFRAADKLRAQGNVELAEYMVHSGRLFIVGSFPLAILALHSLAEAAVKRGWILAGATTVDAIGVALGRQIGWHSIKLSVPGVGWLLTAVGVGYTIYVVQKTPTPLQQWLKGCYFGKPDSGVSVRSSWAEEEAAFKEMLEQNMTDDERKARDQARAEDVRIRANAG